MSTRDCILLSLAASAALAWYGLHTGKFTPEMIPGLAALTVFGCWIAAATWKGGRDGR